MEKFIKLFAIILTIILMNMVFWGIIKGLLQTYSFWIAYIFTLLLDLLLITILKKFKEKSI
jgi:hypothetical protein